MISPKGVDQLSSLDFEAYDEFVNMGYQKARQQIEAWQKEQDSVDLNLRSATVPGGTTRRIKI